MSDDIYDNEESIELNEDKYFVCNSCGYEGNEVFKQELWDTQDIEFLDEDAIFCPNCFAYIGF